MKSLSLIVFLLLVFAATTINAKQAPIEVKQSTFKLSKDAYTFTSKYHAKDLINDHYFISSLKQILSSDLPEISKVDAFIIILDKINWLFNGTMRMFPERNYFETYMGTISTYFGYQKDLEPLNYDINKLLALTQPISRASTIQKANALLLASILDHKSSILPLSTFCNSELINSSEVPAILLHNLTMSAVLARDSKLILKLSTLLPSIQSEEGKEDILCALGIFNIPESPSVIKEYIKSNFINSFDSSIQTGIIIILKRSSKENFLLFLGELANIDSNKVRTENIDEMKSSNFKGPLQSLPGESVYTKTWDDFNIAIYDDGVHVTYKNFSHFRSYNKKQ